MYCYHCAYELNDSKARIKANRFNVQKQQELFKKSIAEKKALLEEEMKLAKEENRSPRQDIVDAYENAVKEYENTKFVPIIEEGSRVAYVCPRCGHLVYENPDEKDLKSLSMASHSELQRSRNDFARGMSFVCISIILLTIGIIFRILANKPNNGYQLVKTCTEYYVFIVLLVLAIILAAGGIFFVTRGLTKKVKYTHLLRDLNNRNFVQ